MPRSVSLNTLRGSLKEQVDIVYLRILKIEHPSLATPYLLVADKVDLVRTDGTYLAFGFNIVLPDDDEENIRSVDLKVPIVDPTFAGALRAIQDQMTITFSVVTKEAPDTVEIGPFVFVSDNMTFGKQTATITLLPNRNLMGDSYPKGIFAPSNQS